MRVACGGGFCAPETSEYGRYAVVDHAPADRLATDPERAPPRPLPGRRTGSSPRLSWRTTGLIRTWPARPCSHGAASTRTDVCSRPGAAERADDTSARDFVRTLRALIKRPDRLLLANGTTTHELSAYARVRAIVAAAGSFPDLWLFSRRR